MKSRKLLIQALAVLACTALVFTGGTAAVASAIGSTSTTVPATTSTTTKSATCNGPSAFKSIAYKVNGTSVLTLAGNVKQGATVTATFQLWNVCNNTAVGIASYDAVSNHGNNQPFGLQTLFAYEDGTYTSGTAHTISVVAPDCYYQVDFYTGTVAQPGALYSPSGRLVGTDVGGTKSCTSGGTTTTTAPSTTSTTVGGSTSTTTPSTSTSSTSTTVAGTGVTTSTTRPDTTTTVAGTGGTTTTMPGDTTVTVGNTTTTAVSGSSTTSTTSAPSTTSTTADVGGTSTSTPPSSTCATSVSGRVTYTFSVNGVVVPKLSSVKPGDVVTVNFTIAAGCKEQLSFASYLATSLDTSPSGVLSQTLFDSNTGWFAPGSYTMAVTIPNCMYQVDFVEGAVITHFGPVGSNNYYAGRILDTAVGGTTCTPASTTTTTAPEVGGESVTTTTLRPGETTTTAAGVEAESVNNGTVLGDVTTTTTPAVEAENVSPALAMTGFDMTPILCFGLLLIGLGGGLISTARRLRQA